MSASGPLYMDTSAVVKLVSREAETAALESFLKDWPDRCSSGLLRVELQRTAMGSSGAAHEAAALLQRMVLIALDAGILDRAATIPPARLRSLDAIHLASALAVPGLAGMVVYDKRLFEAAEMHGLRVFAPGATVK